MKNVKKVSLVFTLWTLSFFPSVAIAATPTPSVKTTPASVITTNSPQVETVQPEVKKEEYVLPYPGILPGHALYVFKTFRDNILEALIMDPARKAEFYLLMADKHLGMSVVLEEQSKHELASEVVTKGEGYMVKAVNAISLVKQSGKMLSNATVDKIEKSLIKHEQVLNDLASKTTDTPQKTATTNALETVKKLKVDVVGLKL